MRIKYGYLILAFLFFLLAFWAIGATAMTKNYESPPSVKELFIEYEIHRYEELLNALDRFERRIKSKETSAPSLVIVQSLTEQSRILKNSCRNREKILTL